MRTLRLILVFLFIHGSFSFQVYAQGEKRFTLSVVEHPAIISVFSPPILAAYRKMGLKVELELVKGGRGLIESSSGRVDGDLVRISAIEQFTDSLIRIPVPLGKVEAKLYCSETVECDLAVLDDPATIVGIVNGENAMSAIMRDKEATVIAIPDLVNLQRMMEKGRFNYIIGVVHDAGLKINYSESFQVAAGVLFEDTVYHYVHQKHHALIPELTQALEQSLIDNPIKAIAPMY